MPKTTPLRIAVEGDELVIRIGVDTLKTAAEGSEHFDYYSVHDNRYGLRWRVNDSDLWARDVAREIVDEGENGSTLVTRMLDTAFQWTLENGSDAVDDIDNPVEEELKRWHS
jgi:hypothetical protein